jgi:hypothetical protein
VDVSRSTPIQFLENIGPHCACDLSRPAVGLLSTRARAIEELLHLFRACFVARDLLRCATLKDLTHLFSFRADFVTNMRRYLLAAFTTIGLTVFTAPAAAAIISFQATDLADVGAEDRWMYEYLVTDFDFFANQGFSIYFDFASFANLESPAAPVGPDWDILTFQPDPGLFADGLYDALAFVDGASLGLPFTVAFDWLGGPGTAPGVQAFTINQFDASGDISILETGRTTTAGVPEPATFVLMGLGAALMARRLRRGRP